MEQKFPTEHNAFKFLFAVSTTFNASVIHSSCVFHLYIQPLYTTCTTYQHICCGERSDEVVAGLADGAVHDESQQDEDVAADCENDADSDEQSDEEALPGLEDGQHGRQVCHVWGGRHVENERFCGVVKGGINIFRFEISHHVATAPQCEPDGNKHC